MDFSPVSFNNHLGFDVDVYDSFNTDNPPEAEDNYLGHRTPLGTIKASSAANIKPIRSSSVFVFQNKSTCEPLARATRGPLSRAASYTVGQADEDAMTATIHFISFLMFNPDHAMTKSFYAIWNDTTTPLMPAIDQFFSQYPEYKTCTFQTYMMGIVYISEHPAAVITPFPVHSLSGLVSNMGGSWPEGLPDIAISNYSFSFKNNQLALGIWIDLSNLPYESPEIADNIKSMYGQTTVKVTLQIIFQPSLSVFLTRLTIDFDDFSLPAGGDHTIRVKNPEATIDINPLLKFFIFTLKGTIPFKANDTNLDANISLTIDNEEAHIGAVIAGDNCSFPAPPGLKGLFFDEVGIGMGLFFKPPAFTFGLETKFHIGTPKSGNIIELNDNTVAMIFKTEGEIPVPLFLSFYVPRLSINEVLEIFTNVNFNINIPINFSDLSFKWSESIMNPVVLPDGSLADAGYHFSANIEIFSFQFHGDVSLDLNNGLTADVEMSPLSWGKVFSLTGDGKGVSIKIDENGNPVKNNFVPKTQAEKDVVKNATDKQVTTSGGPVLIINTLSMPILHLNAKASLFEIANFEIQADINKDGIKFELDYGVLLTTKMVCNLTDFHNLYAEFGYHIDKSLPLPSIGGVNPGSIPLKTDASLHLAIKTSLTDVVISAGGNFDFGYHFSFGDFTVDINISKITDFVGAIVQYIKDEAKSIFSPFIDTAEHWAAAAGKGIITGFDDAGKVMKNAYGKTEQEMVNILKGAGFVANDIAKGLKNGYGAASQQVAAWMKQAGYDAIAIGNAIKNAWGCGINDISWALHEVGFGAQEVANALVSAFAGSTAQAAINSLKKWGYDVVDIANVIKSDLFKGDSIAVATIMKAAGYAIDDIAKGIKGAWNCAETDVAYALKAAGFAANEIASAISNAWGYFTNTAGKTAIQIYQNMENGVSKIATALKQVGYLADEAAAALKNGLNASINLVAYGMKQVGYATKEVASALQTAFGTTVDVVAGAMKEVGYAADDVKNAFEELGGDFKSFADTAWTNVKNAFNPSNW